MTRISLVGIWTMPDKFDLGVRSKIMRAIRSRDTGLEMTVRTYLHNAGYRYRLHRKDLPGRPDLVFPSRRAVIFINGCFWHHHSKESCTISHKPLSNPEYWTPKLERTVTRDKMNRAKLRKLGWKILTIWECEMQPLDKLFKRIVRFLDS